MANEVNTSGYIRKVDKIGRISIPPKLILKIDRKEVIASISYINNNDEIVIKKDMNSCVYCDSDKIVVHESGIPICANCRSVQENVLKLVTHNYEKVLLRQGLRFVIPSKIRKILQIKTNDNLNIEYKDNSLIITKT